VRRAHRVSSPPRPTHACNDRARARAPRCRRRGCARPPATAVKRRLLRPRGEDAPRSVVAAWPFPPLRDVGHVASCPGAMESEVPKILLRGGRLPVVQACRSAARVRGRRSASVVDLIERLVAGRVSTGAHNVRADRRQTRTAYFRSRRGARGSGRGRPRNRVDAGRRYTRPSTLATGDDDGRVRGSRRLTAAARDADTRRSPSRAALD
jgi:hypothetical protein